MSLAAFSTSDDAVATSNDKSLISAACLESLLFSTVLPPVISANEGPSGILRLTDPDLALCGSGTGETSRNALNLLGVKKLLVGDRIRSASLALTGTGIIEILKAGVTEPDA
jgi:hypothetical protein